MSIKGQADNSIQAPVIEIFNKAQDVNSRGLMFCVSAGTAAIRKQEQELFKAVAVKETLAVERLLVWLQPFHSRDFLER